MENFLEIKHFNLSYGSIKLFDDFKFSLLKNDIVGIYGPTGCGKSTLLNKIVEEYSDIYKISYVFQDNKLIENLTVLKNVVLPLENIMSKDDSYGKAKKMLKLLDLENKINEKVSVLSGGERQRVNIARAFSYPWDILLMDEPFSAQDDFHRNEILKLTDKIINNRKSAAIIVSHNKDDLAALCNKIIKLG